MIHGILHGEGDLGIQPVDARTRRENQMVDLAVTATLEDIQKSHDIAVDVRMGIFQTVADAGLGREMADQIERLFLKKRDRPRLILEIQLLEASALRRRHNAPVGDPLQIETAVLQAAELQIDVVIVVEVIDAEHLATLPLQTFENMIADESGAPGQKNFRHEIKNAS